MPKLWTYSKKIPDPYRPKYYTKIEMFIPQPNFFSPFPCVLVSIRNPKFKTFFRVLDLQALKSVFSIPIDEEGKACQALQNAQEQADAITEKLRDILATKNLAGLPMAVRSHIKVDEETGELLIE